MTDRPAPPSPVVAALFGAFPRVTPANLNDRYDERLNGFPRGCPPPSRWYPLPVLDPDVAVELRRSMLRAVAPSP